MFLSLLYDLYLIADTGSGTTVSSQCPQPAQPADVTLPATKNWDWMLCCNISIQAITQGLAHGSENTLVLLS